MKLTRLNELIEDGKVVKGRWVLTPGHELQYRSEGKNEEIRLKGSLAAVEADALIFSVTEKQEDQKRVTSLAKLTGEWKLDPKNRITFEVEKESGRKDTLTFLGRWKVSDENELTYRYDRTRLKTKTREIHELFFDGYWDITEKNRLTFFMGADSRSSLRFRGAFQTKSIYAKTGEIRYQAGVELKQAKLDRTITLFGKWKLSRDLGLNFEMNYPDGSQKAIRFGGDLRVNKDSSVAISLKTVKGEPVGAELVITRDMLRGESFLRLAKSLKESRVEAGVRFRW